MAERFEESDWYILRSFSTALAPSFADFPKKRRVGEVENFLWQLRHTKLGMCDLMTGRSPLVSGAVLLKTVAKTNRRGCMLTGSG